MKSGKCPKCDSAEIYHSNLSMDVEQTVRTDYYIQAKVGSRESSLIYLQHFVCGQCNHMESYVADKQSMRNILREWQPLNQPDTDNE